MLAAFWTAALTGALAQGPLPLPPRDAASGPKLLIKEKDYFLHALPPSQELPRWKQRLPFGEKFARTSEGLVLLHTSIATGEMKVLAAGGTTAAYLVEKNNPTPDYFHTRVAGVAADKERLYVLLWKDFPEGKSYELQVFRPDNGTKLHSLELKGDGIPQEDPRETADKGPLRLHPDGVACFGTRFEFKGTELIKRSSEKKP